MFSFYLLLLKRKLIVLLINLYSVMFLSFPINSNNALCFLLFIYLLGFILFIYLFLAALGLHCCARAFSSCGERGLLFIAVRGLLIAVASFAAEHGLLGARASVVVARGL